MIRSAEEFIRRSQPETGPKSDSNTIMACLLCGTAAHEILGNLRLLTLVVLSAMLFAAVHASGADCPVGKSNALDVFHRCRGPEFLLLRSRQLDLDSETIHSQPNSQHYHGGPRSTRHPEKYELRRMYDRGVRRSRQLLQSSGSSTPQQEMQDLISFRASVSADPLQTLRDWNASSPTPCNWTGISCSSDGRSVIAVDLHNRQLVASANLGLRALSRLRSLAQVNLAANSFGGSMPGSALGNWSGLLYLNISFNQMTGAIPSQVGELGNLQILDLQGNNLTGQIPTSVCNCSALRTLDLGSNQLSGSIPDQIGRLFNLEVLNLGTILPDLLNYKPVASGNAFTGTIPSSLANCTSLRVLSLQNNQKLGGEIPPSLSQLTSLQLLNLSVCNFEGPFPTWIVNLTDLRMVGIKYGQLYGQLPADIGKLGKLSFASFGDDNISGVIPQSILNCTSLSYLSLQDNAMLTGDIPSNIGVLTKLRRLVLWSTSLTGVFPASLANCTALELLSASDLKLMDPQPMPLWLTSLPNLQNLFLNNVNMYGPIPREMGRLSKLAYLSMYSNSLSGQLPRELGNCTALVLVQMGANPLIGTFPSEIGNLVKLRTFSVGFSHMVGPLPPSLANLTSIKLFDCSHGNFSGTIDSYWERMPLLNTLQLDGNNFVGSIPSALGNLTTVQTLDLSANRLTGQIPPSFRNLTSVTDLDLAQNYLSGIIPPELGTLTGLTILDLGRNEFEGSIPSSLGNLRLLQNLYLGGNKLSGNLPSTFTNFQGLVVLDLSHNLFNGSIDFPANIISQLDSLAYLNLSSNQYSGSWPTEFSKLAHIQEINISGNSLSGWFTLNGGASGNTVRDSFSGDFSFESLVKLDISRNNFTGPVPQSLGSLPLLTFFNASYNEFVGPIPNTGIFGSNLTAASFLGNPQLCGSILGPGRECRNSSSESCSAFHCKRVWIPVLCGGVVLLGLVILAMWLLARATRGKRETKKQLKDFNVSFDPAVNFSTQDVLQNIQPSTIIANGSISKVYKGSFPGNKAVAVKVLSKSLYTDRREKNALASEMVQEVRIMADLRHRNILRVVGYCTHREMKALILEYMPEGSLYQHLHNKEVGKCELLWRRRFDIAMGVAEGMKYLHHDFHEPLIHGDLKPSNILLDSDFVPKVADFGLSKFVSTHRDDQASASAICGTIGYIPPEYALGTVVSTKGDVYSYGIVLLELLSGRSPASQSNSTNFNPSIDYRSWAVEKYYEDPMSLVDPALRDESLSDYKISEQTRLILLIALLCSRELPQSRPTMRDVLTMLMDIRVVEPNPMERRSLSELANMTSDGTYTVPARGLSDQRLGSWSLEDPNGTKSPSSASDRST